MDSNPFVNDGTCVRAVRQRRGGYPESLAVTSEFCELAGTAGDWPMTKALFAKLDGKVDLRVWEEKKRFVECRQEAFAR